MVKNRVNEILRKSLADVLKRHGFQKRAELYVRRSGDIHHMIEVQRSRWNEMDRQGFTLNCGVHVPGVTSIFRNTPEPKQPKLTDCCISVRVGMLRAPQCDIWWEVSSDQPAEKDAQIQVEIISVITESALPFVDRFQTEPEVAQFLTNERMEPDEFVEPRAEGLKLAYAGLLWRRLGDVSKCSVCIEEAKRRSEKTPLAAIVSTFAARYRC